MCAIILSLSYRALFYSKEVSIYIMSEKRKDKKGRVLKSGESRRPNGTYQYRYNDIRGKRQYVYAPTLAKLREKEDEIAKAKLSGIDYSAGTITILELARKYTSYKTGVRYNTRKGYDSVLNLIEKEDFCYRQIRSVKMSEAKEWFIKLNEDGRRYCSIQSIRSVLKPAFDMAVEEDILVKNPFAFTLTNVVANDTVERKALTDTEVNNLLAYVQSDEHRSKYYDEIVILLGTGMRISELYGLTIADVDFHLRRLRVERQLGRRNNCEYYTEKTKTASGERFIPLDDTTCQAFKRVIKNRKTPKVEMMIDGHTGFLFLDKDNKPKVAMHLEHAMKYMVDKYNAAHTDKLIVTPHVLRHTFCTRMARAGMPIKELQYIMGHSDVETTLNVYTHMSFDAAEKAFEKITASG